MTTLNPTLAEANRQTRPLYRTNTTASSLALAAGPTTITAIDAVLGTGAVDRGRLNGENSRRAMFYGVGADGTNGTYRVWVGSFQFAFNGAMTDEVMLWPLGDGAFTFGTALGQGSSSSAPYCVTSSERFADTLTWAPSTTSTTPDGPEAIFATAYLTDGVNAVYSSANNDIARLELNNFGRADFFLIEIAIGTATSANCLVGGALI